MAIASPTDADKTGRQTDLSVTNLSAFSQAHLNNQFQTWLASQRLQRPVEKATTLLLLIVKAQKEAPGERANDSILGQIFN